MIYRAMKKAGMAPSTKSNHASTLSIRDKEIAWSGLNAQPGTGGLSCCRNPEYIAPCFLSAHYKEKVISHYGTNVLPLSISKVVSSIPPSGSSGMIWEHKASFALTTICADLIFRPDSGIHGNIEPIHPLNRLLLDRATASTQPNWQLIKLYFGAAV